MDCRTVQALMPYLLAPEGLGPDETTTIEQHLAQCPACGSLATGERAFDAKLRTAMNDVSVPAGLRGQLVNRLATERGKIWRGHVYTIAAAAAVLLAICLGLALWSNRKIEIAASDSAARDDGIPVDYIGPEGIVDYFRQQG